jgi:predicted dehydrogenase
VTAPVRLALLGCGWIAQNRLRQIADDRLAEVVLAVDPSPEACTAVADWTPDARVAPDPRVIGRESADAVMISTPTGLHAEQAVAILKRGLPVFVQKPLGISATEVARVLATAARSDVPVETDLCYRHLDSARALREQLQAESIGRVFYVEGCFHNAYRPNAQWSEEPALAGGGALMDLGIHLIDLVVWLTGQQATLCDVHLRQRGRHLVEGGIEDFARVDLKLDRDVDVRLVSSWDASTGLDADMRLTFYGENGNLELVNRAGSFFDFDARRCRGTQVDHLAEDASDRWQGGPLRDWLRAVRSRAAYREPAGIRQTTALIDAAYCLGRLPSAGLSASRSIVPLPRIDATPVSRRPLEGLRQTDSGGHHDRR